jgi:hypothetical protein
MLLLIYLFTDWWLIDSLISSCFYWGDHQLDWISNSQFDMQSVNRILIKLILLLLSSLIPRNPRNRLNCRWIGCGVY